jgi:hypothetical protein
MKLKIYQFPVYKVWVEEQSEEDEANGRRGKI